MDGVSFRGWFNNKQITVCDLYTQGVQILVCTVRTK